MVNNFSHVAFDLLRIRFELRYRINRGISAKCRHCLDSTPNHGNILHVP